MKNTIKITALSVLAFSFLAGCGDDPEPQFDAPPQDISCEEDNSCDDGQGGEGAGDADQGGRDAGQGGQGGEMPPPPPPVEPTCDDGEMNADETDVDCGGSCAPCNIGDQCALPNDCASGACADDNTCKATTSCLEARDAGADQDGIYTILREDGSALEVYCDMTTDGGGWTLLTVVRDDDGTNEIRMVGDESCTSPDADLACKGKMLPELVSADTEVRVQDIASGDYIVYGGFSGSSASVLHYFTLERDLVDEGVTSNTTMDPDLEVRRSHGLAFALGDAQLRQWARYGGWYIRADGVSGDVRISTTAYTWHDNKMLEHAVEGEGGTILREGHQVLYYR